MYSEHHFHRNEIWIVQEDGQTVSVFDSTYIKISKLDDLVLRIREFPNEKNITRLANKIQSETGTFNFRIQVWRPRLNPHNLEYSREILNDINFGFPIILNYGTDN